LDNIKLEDLGDEKVLSAVFELEYILVEGTIEGENGER
jgi:hypothetical protein